MRAYYLTGKHWALEAIRNRRLKISLFNDMNDPFELLGAESKTRRDKVELKQLKDETSAALGALCFSQTCDNPVLWSHYADKHRGLCLGFEIQEDSAHEISYQDERLREIEKEFLEGECEILGRRLLTTKFEHWRYEDEVRLIIRLEDATPERDFYFLPFGEALQLKEIVVGVRCSLTPGELAAMLAQEDKDVEIVRARLAPDAYKIVKSKEP